MPAEESPLVQSRFNRRRDQAQKLRAGVAAFANLISESKRVLGQEDTEYLVQTSWLTHFFGPDGPGIIREAETRRQDSGVRRIPIEGNPLAFNQHRQKRRSTLLDPKTISLIARYSGGTYERQGRREQ